MSHTPRVAVLGAGYLGQAIADAAAAAGAEVWAVRRNPPRETSSIHWLAADVAAGDLDALPARLDLLVLTVAPGAGSSYASTYLPAARRALELARRSDIPALVYTSSTGVYGGEGGAWVDEESPRAGGGEGSAVLIEAEDLLLQSGRAGVTILRVAGIYGPGRDPRARYAMSSRLPMRGEYWVNLAHRDDIVSAVQQVAAWRGAPRALNCADGSPTRAADIARWVAEQRGIDPATLGFGNESERSRSNQRVSSAALRGAGWSPRFPSFREGFTDGL